MSGGQPLERSGSVAGMRRIPIIFLRRFCGGGGRIPYQLSRPPCLCPRRVSRAAGSQEAASWTSGAGAGAGRKIATSRRVERVGVPARTRRCEGLGRGVLNRRWRRWTQMGGCEGGGPSGCSAFPGGLLGEGVSREGAKGWRGEGGSGEGRWMRAGGVSAA